MQTLSHRLSQNGRYEYENWEEFIKISCSDIPTVKNNKKVTYFNIPAAFDIETSSFYDFQSTGEPEKRSCMYLWNLGINGYVIEGRTWEQFESLIKNISEFLDTTSNRILIIYVHNLSFEFQYLRGRFEWEKVFSLEKKKPIRALTTLGIEFRCSYLLSGYSLAKLGEQLTKYKVQKLVGDLDYTKIRNCITPLTEKERRYAENDVRVVMAYIQEKIETDGDISQIPLTKTGYVRIFCRKMCFYGGKARKDAQKTYQDYRNLMKNLTLDEKEYLELKDAFAGGFTHANAFYSGKIMKNVRSYDFTSSYPSVMIAEKFPMSKGERIAIKSDEEFENNLKLYCCLFTLELKDVYATKLSDHPISYSKCQEIKGEVVDNGRIVKADYLKITVTEQDYYIFKDFYEWGDMIISNFIRYKKAYLPYNFIRAILKLYSDKTTLKGVEGKEIEYLNSKEMLNALYGMCVTDICRDEIIYTDEWDKEEPDINEAIKRYNNSKNRFLFYPWGVWVTAYARRNLFSGILSFDEDYIYSDTDSLKVMNYEEHLDYIEAYNKWISSQLEKTLKAYNLDINLLSPKTIKGDKKPLGVWTDEGMYSRFKTLGAKRYITEKDGKFEMTVAGLGKKIAAQYLYETYGKNVFEKFSRDLKIPSNKTGKNTHSYIDFETKGFVTDYMGNIAEYHEYASVHLEAAPYDFSISAEYEEFLKSIGNL